MNEGLSQHLIDTLKSGGRFRTLLMDVPTSRALELMRRADCGKPRGGASSKDKQRFVESHLANLLRCMGKPEARSDLLGEWFESRFPEDLRAPGGMVLPMPDRLPDIEGDLDWRTPLFLRLNCGFGDMEVPSGLAGRLDAAIGNDGNESETPMLVEDFYDWYLPAVLKVLLENLPEMMAKPVSEAGEILGVVGSAVKSCDEVLSEGSEHWVESLGTALQEGVKAAGTLQASLDSMQYLFGKVASLAKTVDWPEARALEDAVPGFCASGEGNLPSLVRSLAEWLEERPFVEGLAEERIEWESLRSLPSHVAAHGSSKDAALIEEELERLEGSKELAAEQMAEMAPISSTLLELLSESEGVPPDDARWQRLEEMSFKLVRAIQSGAFCEVPREQLEARDSQEAPREEGADEAGGEQVGRERTKSQTENGTGSSVAGEESAAEEPAVVEVPEARPPRRSSVQGEEKSGQRKSRDREAVKTPASESDPSESRKASSDSNQSQVVEPAASRGKPAEEPGPQMMPAKELARELGRKADFAPAKVEPLVWSLCAELRLPLAWHLARSCHDQDPSSVPFLAPPLFESLYLSQRVRGTMGLVADEFRRSLEEFQRTPLAQQEFSANHPEFQLLLFSALVRPALLAPATGASGWLEVYSLGDLIPALHDLKEAVLELTRLGLTLGPSLLKGVREHAAWTADMKRSRDETKVWLERKRLTGGLKFAAAIRVWRHWIEDEQDFGLVFEAIESMDPKRANRTRRILEQWQDGRVVEDRIHSVDRQLRGKIPRRIEGHALNRLHELAAEVVQLGSDWVELALNEPDAESDFLRGKAKRCRDAVLKGIESAKGQVDELLDGGPGLRHVAACAVLKNSLEDLERLFDPAAPVAVPALLSSAQRLGTPILKVPSLHLDESWKLREPYDATTRQRLVESIAEPARDLTEAFDRQMEAGNHLATSQILEILEASEGELAVDPLAEARETALVEHRRALQEEMDEVRVEVGKSVSRGLLDEQSREALDSTVSSLEPSEIVDFSSARAELDRVRSRLTKIRERESSEARTRLEQSGLEDSHPEAALRARRALEEGNVLAVNEYIEHPEMAGPEELEEESAFERFFPGFLAAVDDEIPAKARISGALREAIENQRSHGPIDLSDVPKAQARGALELLNAWFRTKSRVGDLADNLTTLFSQLGFREPSVELERRSGTSVRLSLRTEVIEDPRVCQIPAFGSLAGGRYDVTCLWQRPTEEEILQTERSESQAPQVVLYLGRLTEARRRGLASLARRRRSAVLVIDEHVILFLCGQRDYRLPVLFELALPFTTQNPYTTTAGLVPREMFFGRQLEAEEILNRFGSSLVFGGRQLGKTALLRDIARRHHEPEAGRIVRWINMQAEGLARLRSIDDIWTVIAHHLHEEKVLAQPASRPETLGRRIVEWLKKDPDARILLLLDEADEFLEADRREDPPFSNLERLKHLMDETERRFKIVFAGLHNVQRSSREVNSPLAHLGRPVCIGPLLKRKEWREAQALVESPLASLGFVFETSDLPIRILSYTNYYPSLIQLFCRQLLDHLTDIRQVQFDPQKTPPYVITSRHVEDAYQSAELREQIRNRFIWTLDLDSRYRVLALRIALELKSESGEATSMRGVELDWIRREALSLWPEAFANRSDLEDFRTVLEEMIGLGVLRKDGETHYTLRSANLLKLLGSEKEIEDRLMDAMRQEPPQVFEPAYVRREHREDSWRRSPLTAEQESGILLGDSVRSSGTVVLFGTPASGLEELGTFLRQACQGHFFEPVAGAETEEELEIRIRSIVDGAEDGLTVCLVGTDIPWQASWVARIAAALSRRTSRRRQIQVVFAGDSRSAWRWAGQEGGAESEVPVMGLKPWSEKTLHRWVEHCFPIRIGEEGCRRFDQVTGRWTAFLHELGEACIESPEDWREIVARPHEDGPLLEKWYGMLQICEPAVPILKVLVELPGADEETLVDLVAEEDRGNVGQVLRWADRLAYVRLQTKDRETGWVVDPMVSRAVSGTAEKPK